MHGLGLHSHGISMHGSVLHLTALAFRCIPDERLAPASLCIDPCGHLDSRCCTLSLLGRARSAMAVALVDNDRGASPSSNLTRALGSVLKRCLQLPLGCMQGGRHCLGRDVERQCVRWHDSVLGRGGLGSRPSSQHSALCLRGFPEWPSAQAQGTAPSRVGDPPGLGRRRGAQGAARGAIREKTYNLSDPGVHHPTICPTLGSQACTMPHGPMYWLLRPIHRRYLGRGKVVFCMCRSFLCVTGRCLCTTASIHVNTSLSAPIHGNTAKIHTLDLGGIAYRIQAPLEASAEGPSRLCASEADENVRE